MMYMKIKKEIYGLSKFYTVNKENGEVKKYKSIGTLNSFNKYIEEN